MKYNFYELERRIRTTNSIDETISFKNKIDDVEFLDIEDVKVKGKFNMIERDSVNFSLNISTVITSPCVITLDPVKVLVDFDTDLLYTFKVTDDDSFPIIDNMIDMDEVIWGEIILHMPLRVIKEGAEYEIQDEVKVEKENPFSKLLNEQMEE
ncbi:DUF177 domain-containing protein [bacterium]|nr:DUF177 domain-containing protein [bacterium]